MPRSAPSPRSKSQRAFVVLGMHRGGTSASTRALQALGVTLGNELLGPVPDENPRGFYEDEPLLELSERALAALGLDWDSPVWLEPASWQTPELESLRLAAVESLRVRFGGVLRWGFKNPRTARLLPFWQDVLARLGHEPTYLLVIRNPLSVARSLEARNGIAPARGTLLWLLHMTDAVRHTKGARRVGLDYDALIETPAKSLRRVAAGLGLPRPTAKSPELLALRDDFLSEALRTTRFEPSELALDPELSSLVDTAHQKLLEWVAAGPKDLDADRKLQRGFGLIASRLREMAPWLADLERTEAARREARRHLEEERALQARTWQVAESRGRHLAAIEAQQAESRDALEGLRTRTEDLEARLAERDVALRNAEQRTREVDAERLASERARHEAETAATALREQLSQMRAQRDSLIALEETIAETRDALAAEQTRHERREAAWAEERTELEARWRTRIDALTQNLEALEEDERRQSRLLADARAERDQRQADIEAADARQRADSLARSNWLQTRLVEFSGQLLAAIDALQSTRKWRVARRFQRSAARLRRRRWDDGLEQLERAAGRLDEEVRRSPLDLAHVSRRVAELRATFKAWSASRFFTASRRAASVLYLGRAGGQPDGPFELLRNRLGELEFFVSHLSTAPRLETQAASLPARRSEPSDVVDVVIPVYRAREETLRCIRSVLSADNRTPHEIVVIDDGSDERALSEALEELARSGRITLLRNPENRGFPATVNRGMALHPTRDVVLLNSDTIVAGNWLDRLRRAAHSDWKIATVTPFSNNAEICSFPSFCRSTPLPEPEAVAALDAAAARANRGLTTTIPTAVGFCMFVRRDALDAVGAFDAERFGRGYGEENEFCLRARAAGFRHVLAGDVFVGHEGGVSFGDEKAQLLEEGLAELDRLHPGYRNEIDAFVEQDPVRWLRQRLGAARARATGRPSVLMVSHALGGGTERHVQSLGAQLEREGVPVFVLRPAARGGARLSRLDPAEMDPVERPLAGELERWAELLELCGVRHVHFHHTLGFAPEVRALPGRIGCTFDVTLHDYWTVCPRVHLVDERGSYCGMPPVETCQSCVKRGGSEVGFEVDVARWRAEHARWLASARRVFAPSADAAARHSALLPGVEISVRPHAEPGLAVERLAARSGPMGRRRVAVLGAIGPHKGAARLLECARDAADRKLPLEFHLIGYSDRDRELLATRKVVISGPYERAELSNRLRRARCQLALIPSVWPETFSYTLSEAFRAGLIPVAFDLGAPAERIRSAGFGEVLELGASASEINDRLLEIEPGPCPPLGEDLGVTYASIVGDYYDGLSLARGEASSVST